MIPRFTRKMRICNISTLSSQERTRCLPAVQNLDNIQLYEKNWQLHATRDAIVKTFIFKDFVQAFGFMTKVAIAAEKVDHHPEWNNVYSRVEILLTTHDAGGLSMRDVDLANKVDGYAVSSSSTQLILLTFACQSFILYFDCFRCAASGMREQIILSVIRNPGSKSLEQNNGQIISLKYSEDYPILI